jgi:hypothetical protein
MSEESLAVKRAIPRVPFIASAKVAVTAGGASVQMRISELSARGCYIDTLNPFEIGTQINLHISHENRTCDLPGKVIYSHAGFGMGVLFVDLSAEQRAVLDEWLGEAGAQAN